jgi:paraquat-inducible protein B
MKNFLIPVIVLMLIITACNNNAEQKIKEHPHSSEIPQTHADSLMADVMEGHDVGMAKMGKLRTMQKNVEAALDSIAKLPSKAKAATEPYKAKMEGVLQDLKSARSGMEKWMDQFNMDSAVNNMEQRIKYLTDEKLRVSKVKEDILSSLQKADSLIKAKL